MEHIIFVYDKDLSRRHGQFTVVLTAAVFERGKWALAENAKTYFVKDLESVAARVPDKASFRTALESEMAFRKNEARFFSRDQEFTRLRIAPRHLFRFIMDCRKKRMLVHPDGRPAPFRIDTDVIPEIGIRNDHLELYCASLTPAGADIVVQTMPVTLIKDDHIVQLRPDLPFSFIKAIPAGKALAAADKIRLLDSFSKQPDKLRIRNTGEQSIRTVTRAQAQAAVSFDEHAAKARLYFVYEGNTVKDNDATNVIIDVRRHLEIHRNRRAEEGFKQILSNHGFSARPERDFNWRAPDRPLESLVPSLENHGFAVRIGDRKIADPVSVRWNVQTRAQHLHVGATVFSGHFEMDGRGLFAAFNEGGRYVARPDGALGIISGHVRQVLERLAQSGALEEDLFVFDKADFPGVRACLADAPEVATDRSFDDLSRFGSLDGLRRHRVPADLETVLRPYQVLGFNWLRTLKELGFNGILADDMGLGKSVQVLALIKSLKEEGSLDRPVLLIAPKTLLFNWELEVKKFAADLSIYTFAGATRTRSSEHLRQHHLVLTSYGMLRTETPLLSKVQWEYVILDEAQAIKNADTLTSRAVRHLPAASRLSITGTPIENSAADLWSQFDFLMPGFLGDLISFKERYDSTKELERLKEKTRPYILRRLKSQVLAELPPKTEVSLYCDFAEDQKIIYDQALAAARSEMETTAGARTFHILRLILRLRQIACHPQLVLKEPRRPLGSGKTAEILDTAIAILSEGHKILIFSQFTRHLQLVEALFHRHGIPSYYLDGRTADRAAVVQAFKSHEGPCPFFISLKAGGTGLNLSEASYVFLLDPWWNPAVENQAVDRSHRLGQHQPVTVYRFITRGSIEEKVDDLKSAKKEIESAALGESTHQYIPFQDQTLRRLITDR